MPRGTTQVVTRGASNDWCQMCRYEVRGGRASVRGTVAVRGVSTRQYERYVGGKEEDVGLGKLGEGGKGVVSKIGEIGGDIGRELFGDRGGDMKKEMC
ncbi:hypothetical protein Tco_0910380 [Tanacetum coccineum]|uniref:Uncharacterized protein n=1 Tax=Tanacetum coccineum TaxID=301880 RepID=A0ABQ5CSQ0_9ASTR